MAFSDIPLRQNGIDQIIEAAWFNSIRTELIAAFGSGGYIAVEASQNVTAGAELTFDSASFKPLLQVQGSPGAVTASTTPFGAAHGFVDGKEVIIMGLSDTNTVTIPNNDAADGCILNGAAVLKKYYKLHLIYLSTLGRFVELNRNF